MMIFISKFCSLTLTLTTTAFATLFTPVTLGISINHRPQIIAHRGGSEDYPENTILAFKKASLNGADILWASVQVSLDGVPVLYRPADLSTLTNGTGKVQERYFSDLNKLNAGWNFSITNEQGTPTYPYRNNPQLIPSLEEVLRSIPPQMPLILDMKSPLADTLAKAVAKTLDRTNSWGRVRIYSTNTKNLQAFTPYPKAQLFETRDATRGRLVEVALERKCKLPPESGVWAGFEFKRQLEVIEEFTLGEGRSDIQSTMWSPEAVACFRTNINTTLIMFGVNDASTYQAASKLGIDAVMVDSPKSCQTFCQY